MPELRPARFLIGALIALLLMLQWSIWIGSPDAFDVLALRAQIADQRIQNEGLRERNAALGAEVRDLKQGSEAVEERARSDLGMVKKDETFYQVIAPKPDAPATSGATAAPSAATAAGGQAAAPTSVPPPPAAGERKP